LAVSVDHSFTTSAAGQVAGIQTERDGFDGALGMPTGANTSGTDADADGRIEPGRVEGAQTERSDETFAGAADEPRNGGIESAAKAGICWPDFPWWVFLILAAICGARAWANKKSRRLWMAGGIVPLAFAGWAYFAKPCVDWKLFAAMAVVALVAWVVDRNRK